MMKDHDNRVSPPFVHVDSRIDWMEVEPSLYNVDVVDITGNSHA